LPFVFRKFDAELTEDTKLTEVDVGVNVKLNALKNPDDPVPDKDMVYRPLLLPLFELP
jgi:hypothetical protein